MRRAKHTIIILGLALASCRGPMAVPTATPQTYTVHILATTATYPLLQDLAAGYDRPGTLLAVNSAVVDWATIYNRLLAGEVPFALTTYIPAGANLWAAPIAQDGIAIIAHIANPVPALTVDDLRLIFQGQVVTWAAMGGDDQPVTVVSRESGADTRLAFEALVMNRQPVTLNARLALSSESMVEIVAETPGAIGYVSMTWTAADSRVRVVPVWAASGDAQLPTPETVSANAYPLRTPVLIVGLEAPAPDTIYYDWFAWMQSDPGQQIVAQHYGTLPDF
jgi:ABC-type phosphate transport system substrate-binding protein